MDKIFISFFMSRIGILKRKVKLWNFHPNAIKTSEEEGLKQEQEGNRLWHNGRSTYL